MTRIVSFLLAILSAATLLGADTIVLNTGERLTGRIVLELKDAVVLHPQDGGERMRIARSSIVEIIREPRSRSTVNPIETDQPARRAKVAPQKSASRSSTNTPWIPEVGRPFPDLLLRDQNGSDFRMSSLRGRVVLVQLVAMSSPWSQGFTGSRKHGTFGPGELPTTITSLEELLEQFARGTDLDHERLSIVQILCFNAEGQQPSLDEAKAWHAHFRLERHPNWHVLVGDPSMASTEALQRSFGFWLINPRFELEGDSTTHPPRHVLAWRFMPMVADLLEGR